MRPSNLRDNIHIRPMQGADITQVQVIDKVSFSMPWPEKAYRYELNENPHSLLWVAEKESPGELPTIVGMIVLWLILDEGHIATLAVHPNFRTMGIAHRLIHTALREAIQRGSVLATLEVRANNTEAQQLYRWFGFAVVGHRPRYYRDNNEDAIIMTVDGRRQEYLTWLERGAWRPTT